MKNIIILIASLSIWMTPAFAQDKVLAQAGDVQIIQSNCTKDKQQCDFIKSYRGKHSYLMKNWSGNANTYKFSDKLLGMTFSSTGIKTLFITINDQNQQFKYASLLGIDDKNSCFITQETYNNEKDSIVFRKTSDQKVFFVINKHTKNVTGLSQVLYSSFDPEDHQTFNFNYGTMIDNEYASFDMTVKNACTKPSIQTY